MAEIDYLPVRLSNGVTLAVPRSLSSISTYVLLEQEAWFEKEIAFVLRWLKPGMTVIDIGANVGVYALPMAEKVATDGRVIAYEPASEPRRLLEISRELNHAGNLEIVAAALSDGERRGHLAFGASSELNTLTASGPGEDVDIASLDQESRTRSWASIDFVKIDAEGEELRILAGGRDLFARHSPLVLFELMGAGSVKNTHLYSAFAGIGYDCYRVLAGEPILVRYDVQAPPDGYEINLLAAKPDRARQLAAEGLLVDPVPAWSPSAPARVMGMAYLRSKPFVAPFAALMNLDGLHDEEYLDGLAAFAEWLDRTRPVGERCGALAAAFTILQAVCRRAPSMARLSSFARCAWDWGRRTDCVAALKQLNEALSQGGRPSEPFWPPCARFDEMVASAGQEPNWFMAALLEQWERACSFSSLYTDEAPYLDWVCAQPFASTEMERRRVLRAACSGQPLEIPARLGLDAPDNLNAALWRQPNVIAGLAGAGLVGDPLRIGTSG
jgi:FkbM family methyltransferase